MTNTQAASTKDDFFSQVTTKNQNLPATATNGGDFFSR